MKIQNERALIALFSSFFEKYALNVIQVRACFTKLEAFPGKHTSKTLQKTWIHSKKRLKLAIQAT
jgi:hypothetical protein